MTSIKSAMKMVDSRSLLLLIAFLFNITTNALAPPTTGTIRVCQNKHCCKRNPQISQIISNLVDGAVTVEASGCLSHCEEGPNVEIHWNGHDSSTTLVTGVTDATTAAVQLELALKLAKPIPKLLVAASNVMERAVNSPDPTEQERFLTSVISKLEASEEFAPSTALAHALALRSHAHMDREDWSLAIADAQRVVTGFAEVATSATLTLAYRVWADAEQANHSPPQQVLAVLQDWHQAQPSYRTKVQREIQDLLQRVEQEEKAQ